MVREHHLLEFGQAPGGSQQVAQPQSGEGPRLGERPTHDQGALVIDQVDRRGVGELAVGLVHDQQAARRIQRLEGGRQHVGGIDGPGRVVGRAEEQDVGSLGGNQVAYRRGGQFELLAPASGDHTRAGGAGDLGMHGVGGLEDGGGPTGAAVGQQHRLEHLVGAVGAEHLLGIDAVASRQGTAQLAGGPVRISVEPKVPQGVGERVDPALGGWKRRLVGVEADLDVHLRRVIALEGRDLRPGAGSLRHRSPPPGRPADGGPTRRGRRGPRRRPGPPRGDPGRRGRRTRRSPRAGPW